MDDKDAFFLEDLLPWSEKLPAESGYKAAEKMSRYSLLGVYNITYLLRVEIRILEC